MYWYTVGYLIGAGILCNILNLSLDKMYYPEFQAGISCTIPNIKLGYFCHPVACTGIF